MYIADTDNHRVRKVTAPDSSLDVRGTGVPGLRGDGGPASLGPALVARGVAR